MATLPEFNRLVVAYLEGEKVHSGVSWGREGWAFMVRHDDPANTVQHEWSRSHYDDALVRIGADFAKVTRWAYVSDITPHMTTVEES